MSSMHSANKPVLKIFSAFTAAAFLFTQVLIPMPAAYAAEAPALEVRPTGTFHFELPEDLGRVEALEAGNGPTVVHIQTAHGHYEAQKKIESILHYLKEAYGFKLLLLEGSAHKLDREMIRFFPSYMDRTRRVHDRLTQKAVLRGPELFLFDEPEAEAYGIEDIAAYRANLKSFREVLGAKEATEAFLGRMHLQIERLTSPYLSSALRAVLKRVEAYETSVTRFENWLEELRRYAAKHLDADLRSASEQFVWPMLVRVMKLREVEKRFNASAYETQKKAFLNGASLSDAVRSQVTTLLDAPLSGQKLSEPGTRRLYETMAAELAEDFPYERTPQVTDVIAHQILSSELKGASLITEIESLTDDILESLAETQQARHVLALLKDYRLLQKLFRLEITPEDYQKLLSRQGELNPRAMLKRFEALNAEGRVRTLRFEATETAAVDGLFLKAMAFYRGTEERDRGMLENIEKRLTQSGENKAVVVTGGFHAGPFQDHFTKNRYNYALITPKITTVSDRQPYLDLIMGKTAPAFSPSTIDTISVMVPAGDVLETLDVADASATVTGALSEVLPEAGTSPKVHENLNASKFARSWQFATDVVSVDGSAGVTVTPTSSEGSFAVVSGNNKVFYAFGQGRSTTTLTTPEVVSPVLVTPGAATEPNATALAVVRSEMRTPGERDKKHIADLYDEIKKGKQFKVRALLASVQGERVRPRVLAWFENKNITDTARMKRVARAVIVLHVVGDIVDGQRDAMPLLIDSVDAKPDISFKADVVRFFKEQYLLTDRNIIKRIMRAISTMREGEAYKLLKELKSLQIEKETHFEGKVGDETIDRTAMLAKLRKVTESVFAVDKKPDQKRWDLVTDLLRTFLLAYKGPYKPKKFIKIRRVRQLLAEAELARLLSERDKLEDSIRQAVSAAMGSTEPDKYARIVKLMESGLAREHYVTHRKFLELADGEERMMNHPDRPKIGALEKLLLGLDFSSYDNSKDLNDGRNSAVLMLMGLSGGGVSDAISHIDAFLRYLDDAKHQSVSVIQSALKKIFARERATKAWERKITIKRETTYPSDGEREYLIVGFGQDDHGDERSVRLRVGDREDRKIQPDYYFKEYLEGTFQFVRNKPRLSQLSEDQIELGGKLAWEALVRVLPASEEGKHFMTLDFKTLYPDSADSERYKEKFINTLARAMAIHDERATAEKRAVGEGRSEARRTDGQIQALVEGLGQRYGFSQIPDFDQDDINGMLCKLVAAEQEHLFEGWAEPGADNEQKKRFFEQLQAFDSRHTVASVSLRNGERLDYAGGLEGYLEKHGALSEDWRQVTTTMSPFDGLTAQPPQGNVSKHTIFDDDDRMNEDWEKLQEEGLKGYGNEIHMVLPAGGKGTRLGLSDTVTKLGMPAESVLGITHLQKYARFLKAAQDAANREKHEQKKNKLILMLSADNFEAVSAYIDSHLEKEGYFGLERDQIVYEQNMVQRPVPAVNVSTGKMGQNSSNKYRYDEGSGGHGEIHKMMLDNGHAQAAAKANASVVFVQDTNSMAVNAILAAIKEQKNTGNAATIVSTQRTPGQQTGLLADYVNPWGKTVLRGSTEYTAVKNDAADEDGFSPHSSNLNVMVFDSNAYFQVLETHNGLVPEMVKPKKANEFVRIENQSQDIFLLMDPRLVGILLLKKPSEEVLVFSPVKQNNPGGSNNQLAKVPSDTAYSADTASALDAFYKLRAAGVSFGNEAVREVTILEETTPLTEKVPPSIVALSPEFALTPGEAKRKLNGVSVSSSVLGLDGERIALENVTLDKAKLVVRTRPGVSVLVKGLELKGTQAPEFVTKVYENQSDAPDPYAYARQYEIVDDENATLEIDLRDAEPGNYVVGADGRVLPAYFDPSSNPEKVRRNDRGELELRVPDMSSLVAEVQDNTVVVGVRDKHDRRGLSSEQSGIIENLVRWFRTQEELDPENIKLSENRSGVNITGVIVSGFGDENGYAVDLMRGLNAFFQTSKVQATELAAPTPNKFVSLALVTRSESRDEDFKKRVDSKGQLLQVLRKYGQNEEIPNAIRAGVTDYFSNQEKTFTQTHTHLTQLLVTAVTAPDRTNALKEVIEWLRAGRRLLVEAEIGLIVSEFFSENKREDLTQAQAVRLEELRDRVHTALDSEETGKYQDAAAALKDYRDFLNRFFDVSLRETSLLQAYLNSLSIEEEMMEHDQRNQIKAAANILRTARSDDGQPAEARVKFVAVLEGLEIGYISTVLRDLKGWNHPTARTAEDLLNQLKQERKWPATELWDDVEGVLNQINWREVETGDLASEMYDQLYVLEDRVTKPRDFDSDRPAIMFETLTEWMMEAVQIPDKEMKMFDTVARLRQARRLMLEKFLGAFMAAREERLEPELIDSAQSIFFMLQRHEDGKYGKLHAAFDAFSHGLSLKDEEKARKDMILRQLGALALEEKMLEHNNRTVIENALRRLRGLRFDRVTEMGHVLSALAREAIIKLEGIISDDTSGAAPNRLSEAYTFIAAIAAMETYWNARSLKLAELDEAKHPYAEQETVKDIAQTLKSIVRSEVREKDRLKFAEALVKFIQLPIQKIEGSDVKGVVDEQKITRASLITQHELTLKTLITGTMEAKFNAVTKLLKWVVAADRRSVKNYDRRTLVEGLRKVRQLLWESEIGEVLGAAGEEVKRSGIEESEFVALEAALYEALDSSAPEKYQRIYVALKSYRSFLNTQKMTRADRTFDVAFLKRVEKLKEEEEVVEDGNRAEREALAARLRELALTGADNRSRNIVLFQLFGLERGDGLATGQHLEKQSAPAKPEDNDAVKKLAAVPMRKIPSGVKAFRPDNGAIVNRTGLFAKWGQVVKSLRADPDEKRGIEELLEWVTLADDGSPQMQRVVQALRSILDMESYSPSDDMRDILDSLRGLNGTFGAGDHARMISLARFQLMSLGPGGNEGAIRNLEIVLKRLHKNIPAYEPLRKVIEKIKALPSYRSESRNVLDTLGLPPAQGTDGALTAAASAVTAREAQVAAELSLKLLRIDAYKVLLELPLEERIEMINILEQELGIDLRIPGASEPSAAADSAEAVDQAVLENELRESLAAVGEGDAQAIVSAEIFRAGSSDAVLEALRLLIRRSENSERGTGQIVERYHFSDDKSGEIKASVYSRSFGVFDASTAGRLKLLRFYRDRALIVEQAIRARSADQALGVASVEEEAFQAPYFVVNTEPLRQMSPTEQAVALFRVAMMSRVMGEMTEEQTVAFLRQMDAKGRHVSMQSVMKEGFWNRVKAAKLTARAA